MQLWSKLSVQLFREMSSFGKRVSVQDPQPKNTDDPHLLAPADLQLSHETSWQAQN